VKNKRNKSKKEKTIHLIGIGGIGMSAIAKILLYRGYRVSGSDTTMNPLIAKMQDDGIKCFIGHRPLQLGCCNAVVYSSSIRNDNPELLEARRRGIPLIHRSQMLAKLSERKQCIAVTGAHGKTTTSAFLALIFDAAGKKPTAAVGGEMLNFQSNALCGEGEYFIIEADESDGSFLNYLPHKAVLLNIDREHFDYFGNMRNAMNAYRLFIDATARNGGIIYYNSDDHRLKRLIEPYKNICVGFGITGKPNYKALCIEQHGLTVKFDCQIAGHAKRENFTIPMPGMHNVINALAAIAVSHQAGIELDVIKTALLSYEGTKRRFEIKETPYPFILVEDYAHHPAEIRAVLRACESLNKRRIVVFQPHRYTRTRDLFDVFISSFNKADHVIITDIYPACEDAIQGITAKNLCRAMKGQGIKNVEYQKKERIAEHILRIAGGSDIVLILGAGDISSVASELARRREPKKR